MIPKLSFHNLSVSPWIISNICSNITRYYHLFDPKFQQTIPSLEAHVLPTCCPRATHVTRATIARDQGWQLNLFNRTQKDIIRSRSCTGRIILSPLKAQLNSSTFPGSIIPSVLQSRDCGEPIRARYSGHVGSEDQSGGRSNSIVINSCAYCSTACLKYFVLVS